MLLLFVQIEVYKNNLELRCLPLAFTFCKAFYKTKRGRELVSIPHFSDEFLTKVFLRLYFINWPNFIVWLPLLLEIMGTICIVIICWPVCDVINFEINHSFLIQPFFYVTNSSGQKCKYLKNEKGFFNMK